MAKDKDAVHAPTRPPTAVHSAETTARVVAPAVSPPSATER